MQINIEEIEQLAAEEIVQSLQEVRDSIKKLGREPAMLSHANLLVALTKVSPQSMAVMSTILTFKLAELTAQRADS